MEPPPGNTPGTHEALRSALFGVCTALGVDDETGESHAYVRTTEGAIAKLGPKLVGTAVFVVPANDYLRLLSADKPPPRPKDGLACHFCRCTLLPALSKAEPIGVDGPVKATCHQCGKFTAKYANQWDAIFAWADGHWAGGEKSDDGDELCSDCPPIGYPTDKTRCAECPRRDQNERAER